MALLSAAPASPLLMMLTLALLACSKALMTVSVAANESWVITFRVCGPAGCCDEQDASSRLISRKARMVFMVSFELLLHRWQPPAVDHEQQAGRDTDVRFRLQHFIADAAGLVGIQGFAVQHPAKPLGADTLHVGPPRDQRHDIPGMAADLGLPS